MSTLHSSKDWQRLGRLATGGHKLWRHVPSGRYAIADDSGGYPYHCEDGILWLDPSEGTLVLKAGAGSDRWYARRPLLSERDSGRSCHTLLTLQEALGLARILPGLYAVRLRVKVDDAHMLFVLVPESQIIQAKQGDVSDNQVNA